jgi:hypothetical protein
MGSLVRRAIDAARELEVRTGAIVLAGVAARARSIRAVEPGVCRRTICRASQAVVFVVQVLAARRRRARRSCRAGTRVAAVELVRDLTRRAGRSCRRARDRGGDRAATGGARATRGVANLTARAVRIRGATRRRRRVRFARGPLCIAVITRAAVRIARAEATLFAGVARRAVTTRGAVRVRRARVAGRGRCRRVVIAATVMVMMISEVELATSEHGDEAEQRNRHEQLVHGSVTLRRTASMGNHDLRRNTETKNAVGRNPPRHHRNARLLSSPCDRRTSRIRSPYRCSHSRPSDSSCPHRSCS